MGKPMSEKQQNLQDTFLNAVRKSKSAVTIFLVNGVKLQGNITWFDNFCVLLRRDGRHNSSTNTRSRPSCRWDRSSCRKKRRKSRPPRPCKRTQDGRHARPDDRLRHSCGTESAQGRR